MPSPVAGPLRVVRAALVAILVLALTAFAHRLGGGALPDPLVLTALGALTLAGTTAAARLRFTPTRLVVLLGGAQLALHGALTVLPAGGTCLVSSGVAGHPGHAVVAAGGVVCAAPTLPDGGASLAHPVHLASSGTVGAWMLVAHVVATVALAVVLSFGERALERFLAWVTPRAAMPSAVLVAPSGRPGVVRRQAPRPANLWRSRTGPTRGPPSEDGLSGALLRPLAAS